ncbi:MAG: RecX family transcriptional regulator [Parerythrobacter sp.]
MAEDEPLDARRKGGGKRRYEQRVRPPPKPLDEQKLRDLSLSYVARFSTSAAKLERYLARKLRERGWSEDEGARPDIAALVARYVELGYIDDAAYAKSKAGSLLRRGYGARRVGQALYADGIAEDVRIAVDPEEAARREAAIVLARKRRFGPFFMGELDSARAEKQTAAMLRAGHGFDAVRTVIHARDEAALQEWLAEAADPLE